MSEEPLLPSEAETRDSLSSELDKLDSVWKDYVERVRALADEWEKLKIKYLEKISRTESLLKATNTDLEKINIELTLGLASEDEKRDEKSRLEERKAKLEARLRALQEIVETIEDRLLEHLSRIRET
jgi:ABC-type phosphate transport system auxiliary subunit